MTMIIGGNLRSVLWQIKNHLTLPVEMEMNQ